MTSKQSRTDAKPSQQTTSNKRPSQITSPDSASILTDVDLLARNPQSVQKLQRMIGNQAVQRLLTKSAKPKKQTASPTIQRYESHEHAKFGDVEHLQSPAYQPQVIYPSPASYVVPEGEMPDAIAKRFGVSKDFLIARNASKMRTWQKNNGKGTLSGFNAGMTIVIPGKTVKQLAKEQGISEDKLLQHNADKVKQWKIPGTDTVIKGFDRGDQVNLPSNQLKVNGANGAGPDGKQKTVILQGVTLTYGQMIAMGDFFATPEEMRNAKPEILKELKALLEKEAQSPGSVSSDDWQKATSGNYLKLAQDNSTHFAPSDSKLTPPTANSGRDHKSAWQQHHQAALILAQQNKRDEALATNAFGDHFLTDAFASGHIFNKEDVMNRFEQAFAQKDVQEAFFGAVAKTAWADSKVSSMLSKHETVEWKGGFFRPNINSESRFKSLLEAIYDDSDGKQTLLSAVAKIIHDDLNENGVEVANAQGDTWMMQGDGHLNATSLAIGQKAVAQSQANILNTLGAVGPLKIDQLFKAVWDYVPRPTKSSEALIQEKIKTFSDPSNADTHTAAAKVITDEIETIVKELVERKKLKKA